MNKKFFAALASATMAFSATGSLAVFADEFDTVDESNVVRPGEVNPKPVKVEWNKDNFGDLIDDTKVELKNGTSAVTIAKDADGNIETKELEKVTSIKLLGEAEVKGLDYFTELTTFDTNSGVGALKNKSLDFSENTKLDTLTIANAADLADLTLPKPGKVEDSDDEYEYSLTNLSITGTKLASLDLSAQEALKNLTLKETKFTSLDLSAFKEMTAVTVTGNANLTDVLVRKGTVKDPVKYTTLDLSNNALENLELVNVVVNTLDLSNNHIGALDLSKASIGTAKDCAQSFYIAENAKSVNLKTLFPSIKLSKVTEKNDAELEDETDKLKLATTGDGVSYSYNAESKDKAITLEVTFVKANPMNRLYNPNSGEHFYTADLEEKDVLVGLGWNDEGIGWIAPTTSVATDTTTKANYEPVFRLYNPNAGDHHYTTSTAERDTLKAYGWKDEGTGWYSVKVKADGTALDTNVTPVTVYRQYNPYANGAGAHNYTTSMDENDFLVSAGWTPEGTAWYGQK